MSAKREPEWQVIRMRAKGEYLGAVSAADEFAALKAALKALALDKSEADRASDPAVQIITARRAAGADLSIRPRCCHLLAGATDASQMTITL